MEDNNIMNNEEVTFEVVNDIPEEIVAETKASDKAAVIGLLALAGVGGYYIGKKVGKWIMAKYEAKKAQRFHRMEEETEDNVIDMDVVSEDETTEE